MSEIELLKNRIYTLVNIIGLAIGLAVGIFYATVGERRIMLRSIS